MSTIEVRTAVCSEFSISSDYVLGKVTLDVRGFNRTRQLVFSTKPFNMGDATKQPSHFEPIILTKNVHDCAVQTLTFNAVDETGANFGSCRQATLDGCNFKVDSSFALWLDLEAHYGCENDFGKDNRGLIWITGDKVVKASVTMSQAMEELTSKNNDVSCSCTVQ